MNPEISIIIRAKNEERFIGRTLGAVFEQDCCLPFEVILIDSGSTDGTLDVARRFDVRVYEIPPGSFTFGHALNYGKGLARGEYIINLSAHCIPVGPDWMDNLVRPLVDDPALAATYGRQEPIAGLNPFEEQYAVEDFTPGKEGKINAVFSNSNCAIRKKVWDRYPFDEQASFAEDYIWSMTLPEEHRPRYVHAASVYHSHPLSWKYWGSRFYNSGLFEEYLEAVYGLTLPWKAAKEASAAGGSLGALRAYKEELLCTAYFLFRKKYYRHALIAPIFIALRRHYYRKGHRDGERLYGGKKLGRAVSGQG